MAHALKSGSNPVEPSIDSQRKTAGILRILEDAGRPLGSTKLARALRAAGIDLKQRMVRNYLEALDASGHTVNLGRRGRRITDVGRRELDSAVIIDKVGFIDARADDLAFRMTFDLTRRTGTVIVNLSSVPTDRLPEARAVAARVMEAGLGMGRLGIVSSEGHEAAGLPPAAAGRAVIGTVCSITLNGCLRAAGIPVVSRFGGLLEMRDDRPVRFTHVIHYNGTTLDPLEIFIKARMTSVLAAAATGTGTIGASFREVPAVALPLVQKIIGEMADSGLGGRIVVGEPNRPLLEIPVAAGRVGIVVSGGLNPLAAIQESDIPTENHALSRLCEYSSLVSLV
jgi:repressor of nif and glnA expression